MEKQELHQAIAKQFSGLKVDEYMVKKVILTLNFNAEKPTSWNEQELFQFSRELRKLSKPMIIAANKVDTERGKENYEKLKLEFPDLMIVPCSADSELALREAGKAGLIDYVPGDKDFKIKKELNERQKEALVKIKKNILDIFPDGTGVQAILNAAVFKLLKYITIFPAGAHKLADKDGNILPDCFLMPSESTALDFAFKVHSDIGKNFVKAIDARTKMAYGKDHKLKNGDALEIMVK